jgi:DNA-binding CsgD family transcriptional regulator
MTVLEFAQTIKKVRDREVFLLRLQGATLREISISFGISRERARQIIVLCMHDRPALAEDNYIELYKTYDFSQRDFVEAVGVDKTVYNYLKIICNKRGVLPISQLITDDSYPIEIRQGAEKVTFREYVDIGGEKIYIRKSDLIEYVLRTHFQNEAPFDDFIKLYKALLNDLGLSKNKSLHFNPFTYESNTTGFVNMLRRQRRRIRYYNAESYDFTDFWKELKLEQYHNVEFSALKLFRQHPTLMQRYDIHNEDELHSLLRRICKKEHIKNINFGRMPILEFGKVDRERQVLDMLKQLSPISVRDLSKAYEAEYGVSVSYEAFRSSYLKNLKEYIHNGICNVSSLPWPDDRFWQM